MVGVGSENKRTIVCSLPQRAGGLIFVGHLDKSHSQCCVDALIIKRKNF
jgi:hypothetical protein